MNRSVLERLAIIELAKTAGFHLDEIRATLLHAAEARPGSSLEDGRAQAKQHELDAELKRLRDHEIRADENDARARARRSRNAGVRFSMPLSKHPAEPPIGIEDAAPALGEKAQAPLAMIPGLRYVPGYLDAAAHDALLAAADAGPWRQLGHRRTQIYGYSYDLRKGGAYRCRGSARVGAGAGQHGFSATN